MKFNFIFLLLFLQNFFLYSQTSTYFIKYKDNVEKNIIAEKIQSQQLHKSLQLNKTSPSGISVKYFAKGLAKDIAPLSNIVKVTFQNPSDAEDYISNLKNTDPNIEYVQPAVIYKTEMIPNDSLITEQWALEKIGAFDAWNITEGSDSIIIGVIDTGIDYFHPELRNKIYINNAETGLDNFGNDRRSNNIDDDGNGFVDDWQGWDFTDRVGFPFDTEGDYLTWDNDPMDNHSHGTYVAGILGAESNNNIGIAGVAPGCKILNIRAFDPTGNGEEDDVAAAILYALQMGAKVINMSFGDYSFSYVLRDVIRYAYSQNVVMVASSGNDNTTDLHYPSGYPEVISVGNSSEQDFLAGSYGSTLDLTAPGTSIISTSPGAAYTVSGGTSASAPHVSGAAALILSLSNFTNEEVKQIIKSTSDDINSAGWDLRSGAGRLNLFKALSVLAPANVKINFPSQDYTTLSDTINFNATIMSPYFLSYDFLIGEGLNPENWTSQISGTKNQAINSNILNLDISSFSEGEYTARLVVYLSNGKTTEERINFFIQRSSPQVNIIGIGPGYYGNTSTIIAEVYTDQRALVRLYYRVKGTTEFDFITLDGFNINSQFVKDLHYGFIPKQIVKQNAVYEVYLEAINLAGLKTLLLNDGNYFEYNTDNYISTSSPVELPFTLPKGEIFEKPVNFLSNNFNEILFDEFYASDTLNQNTFYALYQYSNNSLVKIDSLKDRFPAAVSDFNNNGKIDLLSYWGRTGFIDEQTGPFNFQFQKKYESDSNFYPVLAEDIDNDLKAEIIVNVNDQRLKIYELNNDLMPSSYKDLNNYSSSDPEADFPNYIYRNGVTVADLNNDGIKEIWIADYDGDLFSYKILSDGNIIKGDSLIENRFLTNQNKIINTGDFNGDGFDEIAVLYETNQIAPLFLIRIFNFRNNNLNILYEKIFIDQSAEFSGFGAGNDVFQTVKLTDIDNDEKDELILNIFPYLYIFKHDQEKPELVYYREGINSESIFSGDINQNGVTEIGFQTPEAFRFYEFGISKTPPVPSDFTGYSIDTISIRLSWSGSSEKYYIYKGETETSIVLIDSTSTTLFIDTNIQSNKNYYYKIQAFDNTKEIPLSALTPSLEIFSHIPAKILSAESKSSSTIILTFTDKMSTAIENLASFEVVGTGIPNSVSPLNQYSYLLSFAQGLSPGENKLIIKNIRDFYRSPLIEDTITFIMEAPVTSDEGFYITLHEIINPFLIKIFLNFEVNEASAADLNNYVIEPSNQIASVTVDPGDKKIIYIQLDGKKPIGSIGKEYRLKINNLLSAGNLKINSGAGSYIVLTGFAKDLSDVFVYPSPVKLGEGNQKVTFANLPKKAKITIFSLNGEQLFNLDENNGDGGVDFNLKTDRGERLSSGIYFYRVVMLDDSNNEVEEKIGKFAVIN